MLPKLTPTYNDQAKGTVPFKLNGGNGAEPVQPQAQAPQQIAVAVPLVETFTAGAGVAVEPAPLKVALIGTAPSSRMLAPFNDPSWKIWACSPGNMNALPRVDAWFEIHGNMLWPENRHYGEPYLNWLRQQKFPIYMQNSSLVPNATPLPRDALVNEFGPFFFTSSFSWMMALAMQQGAKEIALFGIDMASRDEYILQRPGAYFFFQEAHKRGIKISAPYESDIMQPPSLYGFSEVTPFGRKLLARKAELSGRLGDMRRQRGELDHHIVYLEGALEDLDYVQSIWGGAQSHNFAVSGQG